MSGNAGNWLRRAMLVVVLVGAVLPVPVVQAGDGVAACQLEGRLGSTLAVSTADDGWYLVQGRAARWSDSEKSVEAEIVKAISWAPDERIGGGMAALSPNRREAEFAGRVSRDQLGESGETVSLHMHFRIPRELDRNTCSVTFTLPAG